MKSKFGMFQVQDEKIVAVYPKLIQYQANKLVIEVNGKTETLESEYYIKDFIRGGSLVMLLMYETKGKLYPVRANPAFEMPIDNPEHPIIAVHTGKEAMYEDAEYSRLIEEQKNLVSDILNEIAKRDDQKGLNHLLQLAGELEYESKEARDLDSGKNSGEKGVTLRL